MENCWKLLSAIFIIVASQAVLFVGMMIGDATAWVAMFSMVAGLIGIMVGIVMGISAIVNARGGKGLRD